MVKQISLALVLLLLFADLVWAQRAKATQEDDRAARKQWEEDQRADEYANSLRRRDWLKDRLILQLGMGTKYPIMGKDWFGFGAGVEYITRWHASAFFTGGFIPASEESEFPPGSEGMSGFSLDGGMGWRAGLAYYLFPKSPIHLGFQISYGTVFYDHKAEPDGGIPQDAEPGTEFVRPILICYGWEFDVTISYLSDQWYFLQAIVGVYSIGNGKQDNGGKSHWNSFGRKNPSWGWDPLKELRGQDPAENLVTRGDAGNTEAIPPVGLVFGIGIGFAFEELFPDDTEIRRRERESGRLKQNQFRNTSSAPKKPSAPTKKSARKLIEDEDDYE